MFQNSDLVDEKILNGEFITIQCAHGDTVSYPLAQVKLQVEGRSITVEAAVSNTLPKSVLLKTYVPEMSELFGQKVVKHKGNALLEVRHGNSRKSRLQCRERKSSRRLVQRIQKWSPYKKLVEINITWSLLFRLFSWL